MQRITALLTNLTSGDEALEKTDVDISSLVDTWLLLRDIELGGERNRAMYILKSRGMAHSNQIREFLLTDRGIELQDVYLGPEGVLTGSARQAQEAREKAAVLLTQEEVEGKRRELERKREALEARIAAMRKEFEAEEERRSGSSPRKQSTTTHSAGSGAHGCKPSDLDRNDNRSAARSFWQAARGRK